MENSKDYFVEKIVPNEAIQCNGYMERLCRNMKEQISKGILAIVSDGNEYVIKILPEQRIKKPDLLSVGVRQGISVKELVRCGDCKYRYDSLQCRMYSEGMNTTDDWFCADGEMKDDD